MRILKVCHIRLAINLSLHLRLLLGQSLYHIPSSVPQHEGRPPRFNIYINKPSSESQGNKRTNYDKEVDPEANAASDDPWCVRWLKGIYVITTEA